ncbi:MAG: phospholipase D-like domain-containing protein [Opitutaceae bacterium]|jgi:cardiolipin synthase|nr:phospholipase D-like domain-containing protein [Opitutaceae bacterium]
MFASVESNLLFPLLPHALTVCGALLAILALSRLLGEKRQPTNTLAWLLGILLIPYVCVPLFFLLGGRKLRARAARKGRFVPRLPAARAVAPETLLIPTVHAVTTAGAGDPAGGNAIRLLTTGQQTFGEFEEGILSARKSIHIATFILGRDATGRRLVQLLAKRAAEGVKVRLLLDAVGCVFVGKRFLAPLVRAGGRTVRFMPVFPFSTSGSANLRNHRKIAVFDGARAIIGGHNLAAEYMGPTFRKKRWADFGLAVAGPGAALLNEVFIADWSFASGENADALRAESDPLAVAPAGAGDVHVVASGPDVAGDPLYEGIVSMVQECRQSVWIITPYFIPDEVLLRSLIVKARAGKDVTLIVPARSNHRVADYARRNYVRQLHAAGARVLFYRRGMMHTKAVIVDERVALAGSANFDLRSLFVNFEIGLMLYSGNDVLAMRRWAGELVRHCDEPTPDELRRRRFAGDLAEDLCRLLAPLL